MTQKSSLLFLILSVSVLCTALSAQAQEASESTSAIEQRINNAIEHADRASQKPGKEINLNAIPKPDAAAQALDVGALAEQNRALGQKPALDSPTLLVFVSFSMPYQNLKKLFTDGKEGKAVFVFRGFQNGSLAQTAKQIQALSGGEKVAVAIDPKSYKKFNIKTVPTYVLIKKSAAASVASAGCADDLCLNDNDYVKLVGDVSLNFALDKILEHEPDFKEDVELIKNKKASL